MPEMEVQKERKRTFNEERSLHKSMTVYESVNSELNLKVFLSEFVRQMLLPLFIPFDAYFRGKYFLYSHGVSYNWLSIYFNCLIHFIMYSCIVFYFLADSCNHKHTLDIFIPLFYFTCHKFMIATKYGTLTEAEYRYVWYFDILSSV